jgi:hypothetical protein
MLLLKVPRFANSAVVLFPATAMLSIASVRYSVSRSLIRSLMGRSICCCAGPRAAYPRRCSSNASGLPGRNSARILGIRASSAGVARASIPAEILAYARAAYPQRRSSNANSLQSQTEPVKWHWSSAELGLCYRLLPAAQLIKMSELAVSFGAVELAPLRPFLEPRS